MEELDNNDLKESREEIFSQTVRAGKRTYFFDVKATKANELYITVTESKRRFNNENGKFFYEKHKIFLYKEDFQKFVDGLTGAIEYIETGKMPEVVPQETSEEKDDDTDIRFEDLETND